jgi:NAD(P)-dependent dehydrogenase (short-subunit alcohol dehydrogenase family)
MGRLTEKVAIVTGGGQGIGRASAIEFAREGAAVVVANRTAATGEQTVRLAEAAGGQALFVSTDVGRSADVRRMIDIAVSTYGGLDVLFNNAGIEIDEPIEHLSEESWDRVMDTNLKGHFLCAKYAIPHLKARGGGAIINMSSVLGYTALPSVGAYCATKAAIIALTKVLALELARDNIRVNALAPGSVDTPMLWGTVAPDEMEQTRELVAESQPVGYIGTPEQIARAAVWLASNEVDFLTGETILIDGGMLAQFPGPI